MPGSVIFKILFLFKHILLYLDLNLNINEYLLDERILTPREAKKFDNIMKIIQRICGVHVTRCRLKMNKENFGH